MPFISHFLGITDLYCLVSSVWKKIVSGILLCSVFVFVFKWEYKVALASLSCWVHIHFLIGCNHSLNIIVTYVFFKCSVKGFFFFAFISYKILYKCTKSTSIQYFWTIYSLYILGDIFSPLKCLFCFLLVWILKTSFKSYIYIF